MSLPKTLGAYTDVAAVFKKAVELNELTLKFDSIGKSTHFIMRANYYRTLLREALKASGASPLAQQTEFDSLAITKGKDKLSVKIKRHGYSFLDITDAEGNPVKLDVVSQAEASLPATPVAETSAEEDEFLKQFLEGLDDG